MIRMPTQKISAVGLVLLSGALLAARPVSAQPQITVRTEYYDVTGLTDADIRASMDAHHKRTHGFGMHDAITDFDTKWTSAEPPSVVGSIVFRMPRWVDHDRAPAELQERWDKFVRALQTHEDGHRRIDEEEAAAAEQMLRTADRRSRTFNRDMNLLYQAYWKKQLAYDKETEHGGKQGAVFVVTTVPAPKGPTTDEARQERRKKYEEEQKLLREKRERERKKREEEWTRRRQEASEARSR
ncbi:MAG TPA: DUF922 domain-containing protein [Candidatus Eisenbacteria bacterium]|nr:DUF922 domain-containing protein [Candidatus Eisenbacteria bacterium]